ncbi:PLP-dependent aminotransferase family protein [Streptomyces sp. NPDC059957]|uniref:MocR-like transcription factor YczR n=1 Tax=unclassified Streptomyces TaxID=2593676 RepID=UPI003660532A
MKISAHAVGRMVGTWQEGPGPAHRRLSDRLRLLILDGRLCLGAALPGERDLATALGTSRTTVGAAYRTLVDHGYLATRERARATVRLPHEDAPAGRRAGTDAEPEPEGIDLSFAAPPAPPEVLHAAFATALERLPLHFERHGYDRYGTAELREAVAGWYGRRGLPTSPDHVMITSGAQHAIGLLARTLLSPRDKVVIDHPTYPHAIRAFTDARARLLPVAVGPSGWDVPQLLAAARSAQLAYLIPDFHNPTGMFMSASVRRSLRPACPTIIDETLADLRLEAADPDPTEEPFAAHHPTAISVGSVSKSIWGGLRIGWIRAVPALLERVARARPATDLGTPVVEQLATAVLLNGGQTRRPEALLHLRAQQDALLGTLAEHLPEVHAPRAAGGVTLWARFPEPVASRLAAVAPDHGVTIAAGPRFGVGGAFERHVRLPYTLPPARLTEAVRRLAAAHRALTAGATGIHTPAPVG